MKKLFINLFFILFFITTNTIAQYYGGHDSLLFDGANEITIVPINKTEDCNIKVTYAYGTAEGTFYKTEMVQVCGHMEKDLKTEKGALIQNHVLVLGSEITTGDNGHLELEFYDGSVIRMAPNSKVTITGDMCASQTLVNVAGRMWTKVKKLLGSAKYEVKTDPCQYGVRGTEFSVESTKDGDITKVYEGSVHVHATTNILEKKFGDDAAEYTKLTEDYQAGKITMEEMIKKSEEFQNKGTKFGEEVADKICEAGYMVTVTDKVSTPVPIESGSNWFDDANFKK